MKAGWPLLIVAACALPMPASAQYWSRSWAVAPQAASPRDPLPDLTAKTLRQVVRISSGGKRIRLRLTNEMSTTALKLGSVHVALVDAAGKIVPGSDRAVTFGGIAAPVVPDRAPIVSDAITLAVTPLAHVAVSLYFPAGAPEATVHGYAAATATIASGDQTAAATLSEATPFKQRMVIEGIDVETAQRGSTVVAFGDSITDGVRATADADTRWPDDLAAALQKAGRTNVGVANLGISGNRVLAEGTGTNALARFDRDVLSVPGVSHVIVLEGVNDIGGATRAKTTLPTVADITGAYRQMIARAHDKGVKVIFATILPYKGAGYWGATGEVVRKQVNAWILSNHEADGAVDFAKAVADPADPDKFAAAYDSGDALHPNDAGFRAMTAAIDLKLLR
jgi:lysophospholipase L1-like esterase